MIVNLPRQEAIGFLSTPDGPRPTSGDPPLSPMDIGLPAPADILRPVKEAQTSAWSRPHGVPASDVLRRKTMGPSGSSGL